MTTASRVATPRPNDRSANAVWTPRQHGAWPMMAVPLLMGVAVSRPDSWQVVLAVAAASGYLLSATAQTWRRAANRARYQRSLVVFGALLAVSGLALAVTHPALLLALVVLVPAGLLTFALSKPGRPRGVMEGLAQVAQALVLTPVAAFVAGAAGDFDERRVALATLAAGLYLAGTVFVVRSVIRERGNVRYAALSIAYHAVAAGVTFVVLPAAFGVLFAVLLARAVAMPLVERRLAGTARPLRPIQVGMTEMAASAALVVLAFVVAV